MRSEDMLTALYIVGAVWAGGSLLFVVALGMAARKPMPKAPKFERELVHA